MLTEPIDDLVERLTTILREQIMSTDHPVSDWERETIEKIVAAMPAPEALDTTKPDEKLVKLAGLTRNILDLHRKRSGTIAEMIRACLERLRRSPDHGVDRYASLSEHRKQRQHNKDEREAAWTHLELLCGMLEKDAAGQGDA